MFAKFTSFAQFADYERTHLQTFCQKNRVCASQFCKNYESLIYKIYAIKICKFSELLQNFMVRHKFTKAHISKIKVFGKKMKNCALVKSA